MSSATTRSRRDPLWVHPHLTPRDRTLLALLDDHVVLTTSQVTRVLFTRPRTCLLRLETLRGLGLLDRFRFSRPSGGTEPWKWVLGHTGAQFQAAMHGRRLPTARAHDQHLLQLTLNPALEHLLTANEFFVRLHHTARTTAGTSVDRWWSERVSATAFGGVRPDGHGLWTSDGRTVGAFLEADRGTENLPRLMAKLPGYARLVSNGGPSYPVLFWLPSRDRERNLHRLLQQAPPPVPVATAVHDADPAGPVWLPAGARQRVGLVDLPSDHGPDTAQNPNWRDGHLDLTDRR